jgi:hypothetical protein
VAWNSTEEVHCGACRAQACDAAWVLKPTAFHRQNCCYGNPRDRRCVSCCIKLLLRPQHLLSQNNHFLRHTYELLTYGSEKNAVRCCVQDDTVAFT